jgi:hypothetical protein
VALVVALSVCSSMSGGMTVAVVGAGAARGGVTAVAAVAVRLVVGVISVMGGHDRLAVGRDVSTGEVLEALPSL